MDSNIIVYCEDGFWRQGNIEIVCDRYKIGYTNDFQKSLEMVKRICQ